MKSSRQNASERSPNREGRSHGQLALPFSLPEARHALIKWYHLNDRQLPWRVWWNKTQDPYFVWISEIMLQQTLIKAVIPVFERFIVRFPSVLDLAQASEDDVRSAVRGLGYYRRFRMLHEASKVIMMAKGNWPQTYDGWKNLPGVGDYTAAAVSSIAFKAPFAVVDGNVERVLCRLLDLQLAPDEPGLKKEFKHLAQTFLDPSRPGDFNQALMELGQLCCTVSSPSCDVCPLAEMCLAKRRSTQHLSPKPKSRKSTAKVAMRLGIIYKSSKVALVERPLVAKFLRNTWGFVTGLADDPDQYWWDGVEQSAMKPTEKKKVQQKILDHRVCPISKALNGAQPLSKRVKHAITHHQIEAQVVALDPQLANSFESLRWVPLAKVEENLVSNLDRKAWKVFLQEHLGR